MMNDSEIDALAKGMVPFVRECVSEAFTKTPLPPELAEQVASAVRLLHESSPLKLHNETPRAVIPSRVARIERDDDGNFVPIYDEIKP
jgi:hypothetical protein